MNKIKLEFSLDYIKILQQDDDCLLVQLDLLHLGINRNKCDISKECVEKSLPSFFNKPIIYRLNNDFYIEESTDVVEHARNEKQEKTIFIGGTIPESSPVEYVERDGKTYLRMTGVIHKLYQKTLYNILEKRNGEVKISIELKVVKGKQNDNGILTIDEFKFLGACLLGENVLEGIQGSHLEVLKFSLSDYNQHYLTFTQNETKYKIPEEVKKNALEGLQLRKEYGRGATSVGLSTAKYLAVNEYANKDIIKNITKFFSKNDFDILDKKEIPDNNYIAFMLYGSMEGKNWISNIKEEGDVNIVNIEENNIEIPEKEDGEKVENKAVEKFSLTSNQIYDILNNAVANIKYMCGDYEYCKYWVRDYDDEMAYLYDCEESKVFAVTYTIENEVATVDFESKKEVIFGGYKIVGEETEIVVN